MSSYLDRHADLYDLFYAEKPYTEEVAFLDACLRRLRPEGERRLLDVACGTGRHAREFEKRGYDVLGVDYSADMVRRAMAEGARAGSAVRFQQQDMRSLAISEAPFDAVTCLFDSLGYVRTNEAILAALGGMHRHLADGGILFLEFWHAAAMLVGYDPLRVRRWNTPTGEVLRISETRLDPVRQLASVTYTVYELRTDGTWTSFQETQENRYFLVQEMDALLRQAGFAPLQWFSGYDETASVSGDTWHVVVAARKQKRPEPALPVESRP